MSNRPGPFSQRIAAEIRAELARQSRTRRWLADELGQNHVTVGRWVNGDGPMSFDALEAICDVLGVGVVDMLATAIHHDAVLDRLPPSKRVQTGGRAVATSELRRRKAKAATTEESSRDTGRSSQLLAA